MMLSTTPPGWTPPTQKIWHSRISAPRRFPKIGMRNIKTALAAALCALIYYFLDRSPAFACIGAIFGMGSDLENSKLHGGNLSC